MVRLPGRWGLEFEDKGLPVPVLADDELAFRRWCSTETPFYRHGVVNLMGLQPLVQAEIQWGMFAHAQSADPAHWDCRTLQRLAILCRAGNLTSVFDFVDRRTETQHLVGHDDPRVQTIARATIESLWCVYYSPADTRDAGFIETDHFGRRLNQSRSHFDLTGVSQRWLRDMLWDHLAAMLQSSRCPRSRGPFDNCRRAAVQLSAFLEAEAPQGGHDPSLLRAEHAQRFVADLRHRARHSRPALGLQRSDGKPTTVTEGSRRLVFNHIRNITYRALETGASDRIGLHRGFITAFPEGGPVFRRSRSPFSDDVARALSGEENLHQLAAVYDPADRGLRDVWETIVYTGRRCSEVLGLRLDCIGRYRGLPMLWHDQTKVGNYNDAIRIPETLYQRLDARRATTIARFEDRHGRPPIPAERAEMALFPTTVRNSRGDRPISYSMFQTRFKEWVDSLDLGPAVTHQARHTLATNLLRAGASLAQIRRYLGQVSDRMAEHYTKVTNTDLEDVLNAVWVAGPGSANPGKLLSGGLTPMKREEALALALDLSRRSTPTEGGFCTFQPVVHGGSCPWNLDCVNCDKFVLSGADLLYWRRKQQQWRAIAERAPDDATADFLHQVFEPTARAIDGLEKALAGLGLLDQALALDFRRPQDYFHRIWSTAFHTGDLAAAADSEPSGQREPAEETL
jgi:integrase